MNRFRPLLLLLPLLAGCVDGLGIGLDCGVQMNEVRRLEGRPPDSVKRDELAGDFVEQWIYAAAGRNRVYTFRWGASYPTCEVDRPSSAARSVEVVRAHPYRHGTRESP